MPAYGLTHIGSRRWVTPTEGMLDLGILTRLIFFPSTAAVNRLLHYSRRSEAMTHALA